MRDRVFSLETEYAVAFHAQDGENLPDIEDIIDGLQQSLVERCGLAKSQFLVNGSRFYHDAGHAEWSLPECRSAREAVVYDKAADQILAAIVPETEQRLSQQGYQGKLLLVKNNADAYGNTYGCHENYMAERETQWLGYKDYLRLTTRYLIPFLVTRQVFCGTGRVGYGEELEEGFGFQIMQRADFIEEVVSESTTWQRAIVSLGREQEPLAEGNYRRLHLILGDANMSGWATYLKLGTTGIVLRLLEDMGFTDIPHLQNPLQALRQISRDPTCSIAVPLRDGSKLTAIEIQRVYLNQAQQYFDRYPASDEEQEILQLWQEALDHLEIQPLRLFGKVDWIAKKYLMDEYLQRVGRKWEEITPGEPTYYDLLRMDIQYHNLCWQDSLFYCLINGKPDTLVSAAEVQKAQQKPPPYTRAWIRGAAIAASRKQGLNVEVAQWDELKVNGIRVAIGDPLQFYSPELDQIVKAVLQ